MSNLPFHHVLAEYGYWITDGGKVLNIDQRDGHVPLLMDLDDFIELSPTQPYRDWYQAAFSRGWVRVVAPAEDHRCFRFQLVRINPITRLSLARLINALEPYGKYIFESADYRTFCSREKVFWFVGQFDGCVSEIATNTWAMR